MLHEQLGGAARFSCHAGADGECSRRHARNIGVQRYFHHDRIALEVLVRVTLQHDPAIPREQPQPAKVAAENMRARHVAAHVARLAREHVVLPYGAIDARARAENLRTSAERFPQCRGSQELDVLVNAVGVRDVLHLRLRLRVVVARAGRDARDVANPERLSCPSASERGLVEFRAPCFV